MKSNRWIRSSQGLYRFLLRIYPKDYRMTYETEMFHVFTDQCREAYEQRGKSGVLSLWPRTLMDIGQSAIREHLTDPRARLGLLDAMPDEPLPWKGVLLVLIPGLIFFISQIEQLTSDKDWFFMVFYRAGYFLVLPVLIVWLLSRRFPVWGLIPLGLLYETLLTYGERVQLSSLPILKRLIVNDTVILFRAKFDQYYAKYWLAAILCAILLSLILWRSARHRQIPKRAWFSLGLYGLLSISQIVGEAYRMIFWDSIMQHSNWQAVLHSLETKQYIAQITCSYLYSSLSFLLLIFIGTFFANKFGGFTFLILLGYLLPTVVFGRYGAWYDALPFYMVGFAVIVYRFIVAFIAPVWLLRAASLPGRRRAAAIPVAVALISQISLNILVYLAWTKQYPSQTMPLDIPLHIWNQLIIAAGLGLAVSLYLSPKNRQVKVSPVNLVETS